jgi:hypothetical protein
VHARRVHALRGATDPSAETVDVLGGEQTVEPDIWKWERDNLLST